MHEKEEQQDHEGEEWKEEESEIHFTKNKQFDFWGKIGALDHPSDWVGLSVERPRETQKLQ